MNPTSRGLLRTLPLLAAAGCHTPNAADLRQDAQVVRTSTTATATGKVIQPRRCDLRVAILARPLHEEALNGAVWRVADEQVVGPEARRRLEANGLRVGLITGGLPAEVERVLTAPPPEKVEPSQILVPDGDYTLVRLSEPLPQVSLLLNNGASTSGKDYTDASGSIRMTARYDEGTGVSLRFVPEIQHGPVRHGFGAAPNGGPYAPQQFIIKDGQQEDTLRDLAATLTIQPNQVAVVGCRPERERSLGSFLLTQTEPNSDRILQKVVLVWASRSTLGEPPRAAALPPALEPAEAPTPPEPPTSPPTPPAAPDAAKAAAAPPADSGSPGSPPGR